MALWEQTIIPLLQNVTDALNNWLVPMFDASLSLSLDQDAIPIFAEKRDAYWERISKADFLSGCIGANLRRCLKIIAS